METTQDIFEPSKTSFKSNGAGTTLGWDLKPWVTEVNTSPTKFPSASVAVKLCMQVQEDTSKVVTGKKDWKNPEKEDYLSVNGYGG